MDKKQIKSMKDANDRAMVRLRQDLTSALLDAIPDEDAVEKIVRAMEMLMANKFLQYQINWMKVGSDAEKFKKDN